MRIAVLALVLLPAAAFAGERDTPAPRPQPATLKAECRNASNDYAVRAGQPVRVRPLSQEPLAGQYLGVLRIEDGCDKPVKIADDIGRIQR